MASMAGTGFIGWGIYHYFHPAEARKWTEYRGIAEQSFSHQTINPDLLGGVITGEIVVGLFALAFAVAVLRMRPYRPDLRDTVSSYSAGTRSWWTGEPSSVATHLMPNQEDAQAKNTGR
jgi:hypothetical protein